MHPRTMSLGLFSDRAKYDNQNFVKTSKNLLEMTEWMMPNYRLPNFSIGRE